MTKNYKLLKRILSKKNFTYKIIPSIIFTTPTLFLTLFYVRVLHKIKLKTDSSLSRS